MRLNISIELIHMYSIFLVLTFRIRNGTNVQTEINTHLNVLHINLNTNYDTATDTSAALSTMRTVLARNASVGWHYTSPEGIKPDLHHGHRIHWCGL
jgi:hypothetical protein